MSTHPVLDEFWKTFSTLIKAGSGVLFAVVLLFSMAVGSVLLAAVVGVLTHAIFGWLSFGVICVFWYALLGALGTTGWYDNYAKWFGWDKF